MPSVRSIVTIAIVSSLSYLAIEHLRAKNPQRAARIGLN